MFKLAGALLVSAALFAMAPIPARAEFGTRFQISALRGESPQAAIGSQGNGVIAWREANRSIKARTRSAAGVLGAIAKLSPVDDLEISPPDIAADPDGDAVVVWNSRVEGSHRIQARALSAAGALGPLQKVSAPGVFAVGGRIAMDADGDALIVWRGSVETGTRIQARKRSKAGVLGPIETLSPGGSEAALDHRFAMDADGDAVLAWERYDGTNYRVQARARSKAGVLGPVLTLSPPGQDALDPEVAIDADGDAVVVWYRSDGTHDRIQARARSKGGVLGPVQTLSEAGEHAGQPQVAMDADGNALVTWFRAEGGDLRIQARKRSKAGGLGPVLTLSADGFAPQVAMDADGDAAFTWYRSVASDNRVQARTRSRTGVLGPIQTLSAAGQAGVDPQVAMSSEGDAIVTWRQFNGLHNRVWGAATP